MVPAVDIFDDYAESDDADGDFIDVVSRRGPGTATSQQSYRLQAAEQAQRHAVARVRELNPNWMPTPQLTRPGSIEGAIARREAVASEATQYYQNLVRDAIPWANPSWGVRRLESELRQRGFEFVMPASGAGKIFHNPVTREEVRIMERPAGAPRRSDPPGKSFNDYYYRWRPGQDQGWKTHIPIPNKE